jgi:hypothetical protein
MPTFRHGKATVFKLDNASATLTDISNTLTDVSFPAKVDTAEVTAFGASAKSYVVGLTDGTISISGTFDATVDALFAGVVGFATALNWNYGPEGSTAGFVKYTGTGFVTSYQKSGTVGDVVKYTADIQVTGAVTRTTF